MSLRLLLATAAFSLALAAPFAASAEGGSGLPKAQGNRLGADIDLWPTDRANTFSVSVAGHFQLARTAYLDIDVPLAFVDSDSLLGGRNSKFVFGNPTVGAYWADTLTNRLSLYAGGSLTVSTLITSRDTIPDGDMVANLAVREAAAQARAYGDFFRFVPNYVFLRGRFGLEVRILPVLFYRLDMSPIIALGAGYGTDSMFIMDVGNEFEARARNGIGGGIRLQTVFFSRGNDQAQVAVEPYFVYEPARGFYARVGTLIAVDEPLGPGLDRNRVATIRASLGGKW